MKRIITKILKIFGSIISSILAILVVLCTITLCWGGVQMSRGTVTESLPETPVDFVPEIRLIVFTDTHNENENVADAINTAYALFDEDSVYKGVDGFFGLGDFSSIGTEPDYKAYADTLKEHIREETVCVNVLGNHEFKADNYKELFEKYFGHEINTVTEINGFTCIAFSGERSLTEWTFTPGSLKWLNKEIHNAEESAGDKPIFVFEHPHPFGTVYGSTIWCTPQLNPVFAGHTNLINFSGHSHFPLNDPRSINQSTYTSVGVGAMARFELDENYIPGQHPEGYEDASQFAVVEADSSGRVRIRGYDLLSDTYFCDYFIEDVNNRDSFAYTYKNLKSHDKIPVFPDDIKATASVTEDGNYRISFTEAEVPAGFIVHEYKVIIKDDNNKEIYNDNFIATYYLINDSTTEGFTVSKEILEKGKSYTLTVAAESAYHKYSESKSVTFTVE